MQALSSTRKLVPDHMLLSRLHCSIFGYVASGTFYNYIIQSQRCGFSSGWDFLTTLRGTEKVQSYTAFGICVLH
jgi:hypothetical protein